MWNQYNTNRLHKKRQENVQKCDVITEKVADWETNSVVLDQLFSEVCDILYG